MPRSGPTCHIHLDVMMEGSVEKSRRSGYQWSRLVRWSCSGEEDLRKEAIETNL